MKTALQTLTGPFRSLFNFQTDESKGRIIALSSTLLATVYNVFITGIFYTGFLTMYGMSITDTGILTFMPFLANILSAFSPMILSRFPRRKTILLGVRIVYYFLYIVAVTLMPQFVQDPGARLMWFIVIVTVATAIYSLFSNGFTVWMYNFFPQDNNLRMRYMTITQMCSSVLSSLILIGSGFLTDALSNSPHQDSLILIFRYIAFGLVLVEIFVLAKAKEYPYQDSAQLRLTQVFTLPFQYKKFLRCILIMFAWNFIANTNNGLWNYHLLNHLDFSYSLINTTSVLYTVMLIVLSPRWNRVLRRFSWVKSLGIAYLFYAPGEFVFSLMTKDTTFLYVPTCLYVYLASVGLNLAYSNLLYMNLPEENSTAHITFYAIGCNVFAFLGLLTGTCISSITGDDPVRLLGQDVYSVQLNCVLNSVLILTLGIILYRKWRSFTSDEEIVRVEQIDKMRIKKQRIPMRQYVAYGMAKLSAKLRKR